MSKFLLVGLLASAVTLTLALNNGAGRKPAMGWSSWNSFSTYVDEKLIMITADVMVSSGLREAGYEYINIDDGWQSSSRNFTSGELLPSNSTFPSGLKKLSDYIHDLGLKFGLYSVRGNQTCTGNPGSAYYEAIDAANFGKWGVDYVKYDSCGLNRTDISVYEQFAIMRDALLATNRTIYYSICQTYFWPISKPTYPYGYIYSAIPFGENILDLTNAWLTETVNTDDNWNALKLNIDAQQLLSLPSLSRPGAWNDADMLQICRGGMSYVEYQSHFAIWAMFGSPLILGNDMRSLTSECLQIIANREVIAVDQDDLGLQGIILRETYNKSQQIFGKPLVNGTFAVLFFNRDDGRQMMELEWNYLSRFRWPYGIRSPKNVAFKQATVRDIINHLDIGVITNRIRTMVEPHAVQMYLVTPHHTIQPIDPGNDRIIDA